MVLFGSVLTLLVCGAILLLGRGPERAAAALVLAGLAASLALQATLGFRRPLPIFLSDVGLAAGFIVLTYRSRRVWLAGISLVVILLLVVHASMTDGPVVSPAYVAAVDGLDLLGLTVLAAGAVVEARRRRSAIRVGA